MPAYGNFGLDKGFDADSAIVKFRGVKFGTTDEGVTAITAAGEAGVGVAQFGVTLDEIDQGKGASVRESGITEWECGGNIDRGAQVTVDNVGRCVEAGGADFIWGVARQSGASGERIAVTLTGAFSVSAITT